MLKSFYTQFTSAVCRVCLDSECTIMMPLFDVSATDLKVITFADMLNQCSNVQAIDGDELPAHICLSCKDSLNNAYKFKQLAEESDGVLRQKKDVKPKIIFQNLDELKLKIDDKCIIESCPLENEQDLSRIVQKGGAIGNTSIQKVKKEVHSDNEMDVEYLDEDFFTDSPPTKKKKEQSVNKPKQSASKSKQSVSKTKTGKAFNIIATIKGLDTLLRSNDDNKYCVLKKPIPIKAICGSKKEKLPKTKQKRDSKFNIPIGSEIKFKPEARPAQRERKEARPVSTRRPRNSEPKERVKHVCPVCGLLTFTLQTHLLTHVEQKPYKCEHCSKSFGQKGNYVLHLKKHTGTKDQVCEICGAAFYLPKSVRRHRMIHTENRNFACHLCPKKFYVNCDLTRHLKVHSGYKPFKCDTCSMMFNAKHQLEAHIRMHTGEKPYSCEICNVAYAYKVNLNNHVHKTHGVNLKFKSIYKITPDVLTELFQQHAESLNNKKSRALPD